MSVTKLDSRSCGSLEARVGRLTKRVRGYLDQRKLPYVLEWEEGAIVLQFGPSPKTRPCGA
jgi:hypothetical protein